MAVRLGAAVEHRDHRGDAAHLDELREEALPIDAATKTPIARSYGATEWPSGYEPQPARDAREQQAGRVLELRLSCGPVIDS